MLTMTFCCWLYLVLLEDFPAHSTAHDKFLMNTNLIRRKTQLPATPTKLMPQLAGTLAGVNGGETASPYAVEP